MNMNDSAR